MKHFNHKLLLLCSSVLLASCSGGTDLNTNNNSSVCSISTENITFTTSPDIVLASAPTGTVITTVKVANASNCTLTYTASPQEYFEVATATGGVSGDIRTKKSLEALKNITTVVNVLVINKLSTYSKSFKVKVFDISLPTLSYKLKQGVTQKNTFSKPSRFNVSRFKVIKKSDSSLVAKVTNLDIQELSIFYDGSTTALTLVYEVSNSTNSLMDRGQLSFTVSPRDPLYPHQWHLKNTGQKAFADIGGTKDKDINVEPAHKLGYLGRGVKVAVVGATEIQHEDLKDNAVVDGSYDFKNKSKTPTGKSHGTSVSGIIAMKGWNGIGGTGIAPEAQLVSYNYFDEQNSNSQLASFGYSRQSTYRDVGSETVDVFNLSVYFRITHAISYGSGGLSGFVWADIVRCGVSGNAIGDFINTNGTGYFSTCSALRSGKGANYIKSAGNSFQQFSSHCLGLSSDLSCQVVSGSEVFSANPFVITVGALDASGVKTSYSSAGSVLWISAPGGEYGRSNAVFASYNEQNKGVYSWHDFLRKAAIVSTDLMGCGKGYDAFRAPLPSSITATTFDGTVIFNGATIKETKRHELNKTCNYISRMSGTSAAAPMVSGVVALMLESNSHLTWRDVRYILAKTAKLVDSSKAAHQKKLGDNKNYVQREAWRTNGAGYRFHNWYGFGSIDAGAAVAMASTYNNFLTNASFIESAWQTGIITRSTVTDNSTSGGEATVSIPATIGISQLEGAQIRISISSGTSAASARELNIRLTSPQGMVSNLLHEKSLLLTMPNDTLLYSNAFYGESPTGEWKLEVIDSLAGGTVQQLKAFKIRLFGKKS